MGEIEGRREGGAVQRLAAEAVRRGSVVGAGRDVRPQIHADAGRRQTVSQLLIDGEGLQRIALRADLARRGERLKACLPGQRIARSARTLDQDQRRQALGFGQKRCERDQLNRAFDIYPAQENAADAAVPKRACRPFRPILDRVAALESGDQQRTQGFPEPVIRRRRRLQPGRAALPCRRAPFLRKTGAPDRQWRGERSRRVGRLRLLR